MLITTISIVIILILVSGFFSGAETSMMSLNRFKLRHLARNKNKKAITSLNLLQRPDKLLATILLGNTLANNLATYFTTIFFEKHYGSLGAAIATLILTIFILLFAETIPKTIAANHNEKFAFAACNILKVFKIIGLPLILALNAISNTILYICGIKVEQAQVETISKDELRSIVKESTHEKIPLEHRSMLLGVLDLELATLKDVMVPRHQIQGVSLNKSWPNILKTIQKSNYSKLVVYENNIDKITGILSLRKVNTLLDSTSSSSPSSSSSSLIKTKIKIKTKNTTNFNPDNKNKVKQLTSKAYYVPETTTLYKQLIEFQKTGHDLAIVVDEYGDIQGLVTLKDILEEIVGELDQPTIHEIRSIEKQTDKSHLVQGYISIRELNRKLNINLPITQAKTLSGLITERLDKIPTKNISLMIDQYPIEIIEVKGKAVTKAKIYPKK